MRIVLAMMAIATGLVLGGCFHFHKSQVYTAEVPQPLPPLK